ncbi:MAG: succinate dehydrogenase, cytochrome b556 subunit [Chloroflexota bacterium]
MTSLVYTVTETLRYRGAIGQWSWVLHRITGLGVLFFLVLHVIDTSWAVFYPGLYEEAIKIYQTPLFTAGEFALVAAVVYHALNGIRIAVFDYRPAWWRYQRQAAIYVLLGTVLILIPVFIGMFGHVLAHYGSNPDVLPLGTVLAAQLPFAVGIVAAIIAALILSALYGALAGDRTGTRKPPSAMEKFWWSYMRISGVLILPLVFGHLAMMHVLQGVFDITAQDSVIVATSAINESGTATEFVFERWSYAIAGVYVWRLFDIALLALVTLHGFNGLRYVLTDYAGNSTVRRAMVILCALGTVVLLAVGGAALLAGVDETAIQMAEQALQTIGQH